MITLENEQTIVSMKRIGAELTSIYSKITEQEYLWNGDHNYWNRHAPILFPIVGRLVNDTYFIDGTEYHLPQHGFARDMTFDIIHQNKEEVTFQLQSSEETLVKYPFAFNLQITYRLIESTVTVEYKVKNIDTKQMYFSIGAHPAFNCKVDEGNAYFSFANNENFETYVFDGAYRKAKKEMIQAPSNKLNISTELFQHDALILENMTTNEISLCTTTQNTFVKMKFDGFPFVGLWSKPTGAPFICIEPWYGICDEVGASVELKDKKGIQKLNIDETFFSSYDIIIG